jgi:hypothetical protein
VLPYICVSSKRRRRRHAFLEYVFDSGRRAARYRVPIHLNGRRPRGRGGRVGRVWRTTVVHRTHSVNSYVAVLHALYASGAGPAPGRADVARACTAAVRWVPVRRCRFGLRARALL